MRMRLTVDRIASLTVQALGRSESVRTTTELGIVARIAFIRIRLALEAILVVGAVRRSHSVRTTPKPAIEHLT